MKTISVGVSLLVAVYLAVLSACGDGGQPGSMPTPSPAATAPPSLAPAPTPSPTLQSVATIREGVWAEVDVAEACLPVRAFAPSGEPGNCLPDGFVGYIAEGPEMTGGRFWRIAGQGWAPEENLRFHHEGGFPYPPRPELAHAGLIGYVTADGDVWLVNADGSQSRRLIDIETVLGPESRAAELAWSPQGDAIAATVGSPDGYSVLVADLSGTLILTIPNALLPSWFPDGTKLALLAERQQEEDHQCEFLHSAVIAVFDLATAEPTPLTSRYCYFDGPEWSPDGSALLYTRDGNIYLYPFSAGEERLLRARGEDDWYETVAWAPDSSRFSTFHRAFPSGEELYEAYEVYDLASDKLLLSVDSPRDGCGHGASFDDWQTRWTADGRHLLYYDPCGDGGFGGVWVADAVSGETVRIPVTGAGLVSPSPDGRHLAFGAWTFLWLSDIDGSNLTLLAKGTRPAWQPRP